MTTYPVDVPIDFIDEIEVEKVDVASLQVATFTGRDRPQEFEGDYWRMEMRYSNIGPEEGREMSAFIASLRGPIGTFVIPFPGYGSPRGAAATNLSSPLVNGAGQAGNRVLNVKNAPISLTSWLLPGDIMQVGPETRPHWHEVLEAVDTDENGLASVPIWPAVRNDAAANDPITLENPLCLMRMTSSVKYPIRPPVLYGFTITAREKTGDR